MAWEEHRFDRMDEIIALLFTLSASENYSMVYRGNASDTWSLQPTLHRILDSKPKLSEKAMWEGAVIENFRRHARAYVPSSELTYFDSFLSTLVLMQHYGAPTRLLDWTFSPWVAAYFASSTHMDDDGVIWTFNRDELARTNFGVDPDIEEPDVHKRLLNKLTAAITLQQWAEVSGREISAICSYSYQFADARMTAQQSFFTIAGTLGVDHAEAIARVLPEQSMMMRIVIPKSLKPELTHQLWKMNIGPLSLFPSIDGVGRFVDDSVRFNLPINSAWLLRETDDGRAFGLSELDNVDSNRFSYRCLQPRRV